MLPVPDKISHYQIKINSFQKETSVNICVIFKTVVHTLETMHPRLLSMDSSLYVWSWHNNQLSSLSVSIVRFMLKCVITPSHHTNNLA